MMKWKAISQKLKILYIILPLWGMGSCSTDNFEYENKYQCYFSFDCGIHQGSTLQNCLNPISPGLFCMVWQEFTGGVNHIKIQLHNKQAEDVAFTTEIEKRRSCILGANNGLVIGCSTLNSGQIYAFDRICPNCVNNNGIKTTLQWENNGLWLKCHKCERVYDLNNNGFIVKGESGDKLLRYRASYDGKVLFISN